MSPALAYSMDGDHLHKTHGKEDEHKRVSDPEYILEESGMDQSQTEQYMCCRREEEKEGGGRRRN